MSAANDQKISPRVPFQDIQTSVANKENISNGSICLNSGFCIVSFNGVSCMGKSEFIRGLKKHASAANVTFHEVSKDTVARPLMDAYAQENPNVPFANIYMTILGPILSTFESKLFEIVDNLDSNSRHVLIIDDAIPNPKLLQSLIARTPSALGPAQILIIQPRTLSQKKECGDFSLQFVANLCLRVLNRKQHETMLYDDVKKVQIVLSFVKIYKALTEDSLRAAHNDASYPAGTKLVEVEFHQEWEGSVGNQKVQTVYASVLRSLNSLGAPFETPFITGEPEVQELVTHLHALNALNTESSSGQSPSQLEKYINYGRTSEWTKSYAQLLPAPKTIVTETAKIIQGLSC